MDNSPYVINSKRDLNAGFAKNASLAFCQNTPVVAITVAEVVEAAAALPLVFVRVGETDYRFMALLGLHNHENLVLQKTGRWRAFYLPQVLKLYPFSLVRIGDGVEGEQRFAACFDQRSGLYREAPNSEAGETRFFNDEGQPSEAYAGVIQLLQRHQHAMAATQHAVDALAQEGLLVPMRLPADPGSDSAMQGIYTVDESKLNALDDAALGRLHSVRALPVAYAQLFSSHNLRLLKRLSEIESQVPPTLDEGGVETLFKHKDDTLQFNF